MFSFDVDEDRTAWWASPTTFVEPARWREAAHDPELFTAVMTTDDGPRAGCEFVWKNAGEDVFIASHDPKRCHAAGGAKAAQRPSSPPTALSIGDFHFRRTKGH